MVWLYDCCWFMQICIVLPVYWISFNRAIVYRYIHYVVLMNGMACIIPWLMYIPSIIWDLWLMKILWKRSVALKAVFQERMLFLPKWDCKLLSNLYYIVLKENLTIYLYYMYITEWSILYKDFKGNITLYYNLFKVDFEIYFEGL